MSLGRVVVVDERSAQPTNIAVFSTIREAEAFIQGLEFLIPEAVHDGKFGIDADERENNAKPIRNATSPEIHGSDSTGREFRQ